MTKTEKQTGRQVELDLLKALAIISMILCHYVTRLGLHQPGYEQDVCYWFGDYFFGVYMAVAHAFMFAMGVGIIYSRKSSPANLILRGIRLYVLGFVDSIFCYLLGIVFPWAGIYLFGIVLTVLADWIAKAWMERKRQTAV